MERLANLLSRSKFASGCMSAEQIAVAAWAASVGKRLSVRTRAVTLVDGRLIVEVPDEVWKKQLRPLEGQIVDNLEKVLGDRRVKSIAYRIAIPRRGPAREESLELVRDDADGIADPILNRIYRAKRRRATA